MVTPVRFKLHRSKIKANAPVKTVKLNLRMEPVF